MPAVAAFGEAVKIYSSALGERYRYTEELRSYLIEGLTPLSDAKGLKLILPERHAPHILNVILPAIKSETMLHYLSSLGIYVSSGSACSSNARHLSSALLAFGVAREDADYSIRISLSYRNTREECDRFISALDEGIARLAKVR